MRWAIPLLLVPVTYFAGATAIYFLQQAESPDAGIAVLALLAIAVALVGPAVAAIVAIVGGVKVMRPWLRARRHARGKFTQAESQAIARKEFENEAWNHARSLVPALARREVPPAIRVWDIVPNPNETFFYDVTASYARFYGQDVSYTQTGGFFFGRPGFVLAGIAATAIDNASRRSAAQAQAQAQWREHQPVRLLVSNERLVCNVQGEWLSFYYSAMTAVYPEVQDWTLVCQFGRTSPMMLSGPYVPAAALITVLCTLGPEALTQHPSLHRLAETS